jgi:hypothetical protein
MNILTAPMLDGTLLNRRPINEAGEPDGEPTADPEPDSAYRGTTLP